MGLGWGVSVFRLAEGGSSPATKDSVGTELVGFWDTGLFGLNWIDELVKAGRVIDLGFEGLLQQYTGPAELLLPDVFKSLPPDAPAAPNGMRRDEWLLVHAWDQS
jgi:hypothetical protein